MARKDSRKETVELERVITPETGRTYRMKGVLMEFDGNVPQLVAGTPVETLNDSGGLIGYATVYVDGNKLLAEIDIDYQTPERLLIETGELLYPAGTFGTVHAPTDTGSELTCLVVTAITVRSTPPVTGNAIPLTQVNP